LSLDWRDKARKPRQGKEAGDRKDSLTFSPWEAITAYLCEVRYLKNKTQK